MKRAAVSTGWRGGDDMESNSPVKPDRPSDHAFEPFRFKKIPADVGDWRLDKLYESLRARRSGPTLLG